MQTYKGKKIAVVGLSVEGLDSTRFFAREGALVTCLDRRTKVELGSTYDELTGLGVSFELGDWYLSHLDKFDLIVRTAGISPREFSEYKDKLTSQTKLFFDLCEAPIIGVTGTKGKGTTSSLIFKILEAAALRQAHGRKVYLAGNIGRDPFEFIDKLTPNDFVILELSSFQLQDLHKSPHIAVVLKITPEHLDHHQDLAEYIEAKTSIVRFQSASDFAVLSYDSESTRTFAGKTKARIVWNSIKQEVKPGCYATDRKIFLNGEIVAKTAEVALLGRFNLENVTAAIAAAAAAGVTDGT